MDLDLLLKELVDVASIKIDPKATKYFSDIDLNPTIIRLGCGRILNWLRVQSVALRLLALELDISSDLDLACIKLLERAESLQDIVHIREGMIMFNEKVTVGQALKMMKYAKDNYAPHAIT